MSSSPLPVLAMVAASLAFTACADPAANDAPQDPPEIRPAVIWSEPVEGLALGIEQRGRVVFPAGVVNVDELVRVHLRNERADEVIWSDSLGKAWTIRFRGAEFEQPKPFTDPMPPPYIGDPRRIEPGDECIIEIPIVRAFVLWGLVPAGEYSIAVSYHPGDLRTWSRGEARPFDHPNFWADRITTPEIVIRVEESPPPGL